MYSTLFWYLFVVSMDLRLNCVTTVTPFIHCKRRSEAKAGHCDLAGSWPDQWQQNYLFFRNSNQLYFFFQPLPKKETSPSSLRDSLV